MDAHGERKDLCSLGRWSIIPYVHESDECCIARFVVVSSELHVELEFRSACLNPLPA
jgi:hypothetical protein